MKQLFYLLLVLAVTAQVCSDDVDATRLDFKGASQYEGNNLDTLSCNAQTRIDFEFDQSASDLLNVTLASGNYYTFDHSQDSSLQFLNRDGKELEYDLKGVAINPYSNARAIFDNIKTTPDYELSVTFTNQDQNQDTIVSIYFLKATTLLTGEDPNVVVNGEATVSQINGFYGLVKSFVNVSESGAIRNIAGGLAYLQNPDLSQFYTVQIEPAGCEKKVNFLVSGFIIKLSENIDFSNITGATTFTYTQNQKTANRLCYGSHNNEGVFQTHMRESYPLWAAWFSALFFWFFILFGESKTLEVYDKSFENNRWTSWELYSLWHLGHDDFFSKLMRATAYYSSFWIICLVSSALYGYIQSVDLHALTILYFGIAGCFAAFFFSFFSGFFLTGVSKWSLKKYLAKKNIKLLSDKQGSDAVKHEIQIDDCEDRIYIYYYWFYILTLFVLIVCWTLSINFMQRPQRQYYHLMYYWIGSVGVGIGLYSLVLTPLWSLLAGNYAIAQIRGFWYDYRLGETFREVQI